VLRETPELPERELNARLRRADWRFLLPTFRPRRAIARATGALAEAVASIAGEVVAAAPNGACDLAVAENADSRTLAKLHDALEPGCVCYGSGVGSGAARGGSRACFAPQDSPA
jgi:hypothetical protein